MRGKNFVVTGGTQGVGRATDLPLVSMGANGVAICGRSEEGGGIHYSEAWAELAAFAERFGVPVGETHASRGAIRNGSDLLMGGTGQFGTPAAGQAAEEADPVFCIGTRLHDFVTDSNAAFQSLDVKFVSINVNDRDAYKSVALPLTADAKLSLTALAEADASAGVQPNVAWVEAAKSQREAWEETKRTDVFVQHPGEKVSQGQIVGILNEEMNAGDALVAAAGTIPSDLTKPFDVKDGQLLHIEFGNSCMGYDSPAAIGVKLAGTQGEVIILMGDGNYQMHPMELVTAVQERTKITVVLKVNYGYQSIHGHQKALVGHSLGNEFKLRDAGSGLRDKGEFIEVDHVRNAESVEARDWFAETEDEIRAALREARDESRPCVTVVPTEKYRFPPDSGVWREVVGAEITNDSKTAKLVEEREAGRAKQRFCY